MEIRTTVKRGLPCRARLISYEPYRCNRRGHIDNWLPDDPEVVEIELLTLRGQPAPWLERDASDADWRRIEGELVAAMEAEALEMEL